MSSILEALKKLEADKGPQASVEAMSATDEAYVGSALLDDRDVPMRDTRPVAPLLWVLGGGVFTVLIIGVSVLLVMFLLQQNGSDRRNTDVTAQVPPPLPTPPATPPVAAASAVNTGGLETETDGTVEATPPPLPPDPVPIEAQVVVPVELPKAVVEPNPEPQPRRHRPEPEPRAEAAPSSAPMPEDIRSLPMMTRHDRAQYNLEGIQLNMLNAAGPTRPLGNAFINLEKVFIGEFLPDSNAVLLDVQSHGIAVEIQSTQQRYYIPR